MSEQHELRVSDGERQAAAERLRAAHDEGRLDLYEYDNRLVQAYSSVTYADLDRLFADLPVTTTSVPAAPSRAPAVRATSAPAPVRHQDSMATAFAGLPIA